MFKDFSERFDYLIKGEVNRFIERLPETDMYNWCRYQENAAQHRVQRTAFSLSAIALAVGIIIGWFIFGG